MIKLITKYYRNFLRDADDYHVGFSIDSNTEDNVTCGGRCKRVGRWAQEAFKKLRRKRSPPLLAG